MLVPLNGTVRNTEICSKVFFLKLGSQKEWEHTSRFAPYDVNGEFHPWEIVWSFIMVLLLPQSRAVISRWHICKIALFSRPGKQTAFGYWSLRAVPWPHAQMFVFLWLLAHHVFCCEGPQDSQFTISCLWLTVSVTTSQHLQITTKPLYPWGLSHPSMSSKNVKLLRHDYIHTNGTFSCMCRAMLLMSDKKKMPSPFTSEGPAETA